jgi:hypothetical protein
MSYKGAIIGLSSLEKAICVHCKEPYCIVGRRVGDDKYFCSLCFIGYERRSIILFGDLNQTILYEMRMIDHASHCLGCTEKCRDFKKLLKHQCMKKKCSLCLKRKKILTIHDEIDSILGAA